MSDLTVIYYSSNREPIEGKIVEQLLKSAGGLPIISVTHKPMDLGRNICVGEQYPCDANIYRQIQIACDEANTEYVIHAESDCLYPPEYFTFEPDGEHNIYRYQPVYILFAGKPFFYRKKWCEGGQVANREYLADKIAFALDTYPMWSKLGDKKFVSTRNGVYKRGQWGTFEGRPIVSLKTGYGIRRSCGVEANSEKKMIPYWCTVNSVNKMLSL